MTAGQVCHGQRAKVAQHPKIFVEICPAVVTSSERYSVSGRTADGRSASACRGSAGHGGDHRGGAGLSGLRKSKIRGRQASSFLKKRSKKLFTISKTTGPGARKAWVLCCTQHDGARMNEVFLFLFVHKKKTSPATGLFAFPPAQDTGQAISCSRPVTSTSLSVPAASSGLSAYW